MPHISIRNLNVRYGNHHALKNITVDIPDGGVTAIIGPSGCGKTTLLKSLNRLIELNEEIKVTGEVLIDGVNIYDPKADLLSHRKKVGFMSQKPFPLPMSIYNNVAYGPKIQRMDAGKIAEQLAAVERSFFSQEHGLKETDHGRKSEWDRLVEYYLRLAGLWEEVKDRLHQPANRLSVGQQQRLALARAMAVGPEVILADEPTSALDPNSAGLIEKQFNFLKKDFTIVLVTHALIQAMRLADYVIFLYYGEVIEQGTAEAILREPKADLTKEFVKGYGDGI